MWSPPRRHRLFTCATAVVLLVGFTACGGDDDDATADPTPTTGSSASAPDEGGSFELLAYNVAGLPQEISGENPEVNIPLISPLLADHDLVLTQEDFDWWAEGELADGLDFNEYHDRLLADAGFPHVTPRHPGPEAAGVELEVRPAPLIGDGIGIFSQLPMSDHVAQAWTGCFGGFDTSDGGAADCLAMKGFRVATVDLGGVAVDVYSLHGEAGGTDTDQALQADGYEQLADFIETHSGDRAVIVGGDTNLHTDPEHPDAEGQADTEIWEGLLERLGLTDACTALECDHPGDIDKVAFRSDSTVRLEATAYDQPVETFVDAEGEALSDHDPVAVTFRWTPLG